MERGNMNQDYIAGTVICHMGRVFAASRETAVEKIEKKHPGLIRLRVSEIEQRGTWEYYGTESDSAVCTKGVAEA
jgi:hypothetical protein